MLDTCPFQDIDMNIHKSSVSVLRKVPNVVQMKLNCCKNVRHIIKYTNGFASSCLFFYNCRMKLSQNVEYKTSDGKSVAVSVQ